ncbi:hypothetical protein HD554DRAFT_2312642 [Boletus coccyginus]|nr:hypothetical protein HD554DRAFT_2312642 [Boletus coccyginus]
MAPASKRARTTATPTVDGPDLSGMPAQPQLFIHFHTGPSLDRIPDDVLHEILSHLPTLDDRHVLLGRQSFPHVVSSAKLVRTPTLRALSQTSRLLRSRCLGMAWRNVELCGVNVSKSRALFHSVIGEATMACVRVLKTCPHLLPLIRTVFVVLTFYNFWEIIPAFAACLATLPNLTVIQVIHAHSRLTTVIKDAFEGKRFPSVRRITLPGYAHEIIKSCPNLEEVMCTDGDGSTIIGSLVKGHCTQVRVLKGISPHLTRLKLLPNLTHIGVDQGGDMTPLISFPLLDTIEILVHSTSRKGRPLSKLAARDVKLARKILKKNKTKAEKTVLLTKLDDVWDHARSEFDPDKGYMDEEAGRLRDLCLIERAWHREGVDAVIVLYYD